MQKVKVRYIGGLDGVYINVGDDDDPSNDVRFEPGEARDVPAWVAEGREAGENAFGDPVQASAGLLVQVDNWERVEAAPAKKTSKADADGDAPGGES